MTVIRTRGKWDAAYDLLNLLLKDVDMYCNMCGAEYVQGRVCCDNPQIGSNIDHLTAVVKQNKTKIATNKDSYGSMKGNHMRSCMSMPPVLFDEWCRAFENLYGEKLFNTHKDMMDCMRKMPFLKTCERV